MRVLIVSLLVLANDSAKTKTKKASVNTFEDIFADDKDNNRSLSTLGDVCQGHNWVCYASF
jgi:hypothetical protein